jgi:hypothetical protein
MVWRLLVSEHADFDPGPSEGPEAMADHRTGQVRRDGNGLRAGARWMHTARLVGLVALLLCLTGIAAAGAAQASQPSKAAGSTWQIEPTPNPAGAEYNALSALSCTSGWACTAVGSSAASLSSFPFALAERWNGTSWQIQPAATPEGATSTSLFAVSCASANACIAVGNASFTAGKSSVFLAEAWNGRSWRVQAIPTPKGAAAGALYAVSCTSPSACTAAGDYGNAVAERWNGKTWRIQAVPRPAKLTRFFGVSCSAARACTAVGYQNNGTGDAQPFAEGWNGRTWHVQTVPLPHGAPGGALSAVSCTSPGACTATGTNFGVSPTLALRWNGKNWRIQPTPNPANYRSSASAVTLDGVSCTSATACAASGEYSPGGGAAYFVEAWNGSSWRLQTTPVPVGFVHGFLLGMSCHCRRCTTVGGWSGGVVPQATLAMAD